MEAWQAPTGDNGNNTHHTEICAWHCLLASRGTSGPWGEEVGCTQTDLAVQCSAGGLVECQQGGDVLSAGAELREPLVLLPSKQVVRCGLHGHHWAGDVGDVVLSEQLHITKNCQEMQVDRSCD